MFNTHLLSTALSPVLRDGVQMAHKGTGPDSSLPRSPRGPLNPPSSSHSRPSFHWLPSSRHQDFSQNRGNAQAPHASWGLGRLHACSHNSPNPLCLSCPVLQPRFPIPLKASDTAISAHPMPYIYLGLYPTWPAGGAETPLSPALDWTPHPTRTLSLPHFLHSTDRSGLCDL